MLCASLINTALTRREAHSVGNTCPYVINIISRDIIEDYGKYKFRGPKSRYFWNMRKKTVGEDAIRRRHLSSALTDD